MGDLNISPSDRSKYSKALMEYRSSRNIFRSKLFYSINEINNTLSDITLKQIKEEFNTKLDELKEDINKIEENYKSLLERVEKLENS